MRRRRRRRIKLTFFASVAIYFACASIVLGLICAKLEWWGIALAIFCMNNTYFVGYLLARTNWIKGEV